MGYKILYETFTHIYAIYSKRRSLYVIVLWLSQETHITQNQFLSNKLNTIFELHITFPRRLNWWVNFNTLFLNVNKIGITKMVFNDQI